MEQKHILEQIMREIFNKVEDKAFTYEELQPLMNQYMELKKVSKDSYIAKENITISKVYCVIDGEYIITHSSARGQMNLVNRLKAPQFIGIDRALGVKGVLASDCLAMTDCLVLEINRMYFMEMLKNNGDIAVYVIKNLCEKMTLFVSRMNRLRFDDAADNLMKYIYIYWMEHRQPGKKLRIQVKNALIAHEIGSSERTFYRAANQLKEQGLIAVEKGCIVVDMEQIVRIEALCDV